MDYDFLLKQAPIKNKQKYYKGFSKTSPGEYGEGDIFLGIKVPALRKPGKTAFESYF